MAKKLDWKKIWKEFGDWFDDRPSACETCGRLKDSNKDEWDVQQRAIQRIVNKELSRG